MALVLADRVQETSTTTGTGTFTLAGAVTGYQSFAAIGNANTTYYTIAHQTLSEWEVGIGTYTSSGTTLSRTTVLASSNSGSLVTFSAGTKNVFCTYPSGKAVYEDSSNNVTLPGTLTATTGITSTRIDPRVSSTTSTTSITPDISAYDQYAVTAQAVTLTINAPTGTPVNGNKLIFRLLDNGSAQTISWNGTYTAIGVTLPPTTTASKTTYVGCIYNAAATRWDVVAVVTQA